MPKGVYKRTKPPWNKGLKYSLSEETKMKMNRSEKHKGEGNPFYGKTHTDEYKQRMSEIKSGKHYSPETEFGKLDEHPFWQGGKSFEKYTTKFNHEFKESIRDRDKRTCQECGVKEESLKYKLSVHHIDFDKHNNNKNNLICLCRKCHAKTVYNREDWISYYKNKVRNFA